MLIRTFSVTFLLGFASCIALARHGHCGGPPQVAIDACVGVAVAQACRFEAPHGEITGTCRRVSDDSVACMPAGGAPMHGSRPSPPPEAFSACDDAPEGSACSVHTPHGILTGKCYLPPDVSEQQADLVCVPAGRPPRRDS